MSAFSRPAYANSCTIAVNGQTSGQVFIQNGQSVSITIQNAEIHNEYINAPDDTAFYINVPQTWKRYYIPSGYVNNGNISFSLAYDSWDNNIFNKNSTHTLQLVRDWGQVLPHTVVCTSSVQVVTDNSEEKQTTHIDNFDYCSQVPDDGRQRSKCLECVEKGDPGDYVYTAVGCMRVSGKGLTEDIVRVFMGVSGGVALFSIISAAFLFTLSQGDTNKVKQAKELLTAAVTGLFFIILSIFILQFIGVNILGIPGLTGEGAPQEQAQPQFDDPNIRGRGAFGSN